LIIKLVAKMFEKPFVKFIGTILFVCCYSCLFAQQSYVDSRTAVENVWELSSTETSLRKPAIGSPYMTALEMTKRVEKLTHYLSHAWNLINSYYSNKSEREELFFKKIDHINVQIADISHRLIGMEHGFISIQTMLKHFSRGTLLQENLNTLNLYQIYIDKFYKKMEKYVMDFQDHKRTLVEFANKTLYLGVKSVPHLMLATRNLATAPDFLKLLFKRFAPGNKEFFCKEHQSSQQALDNFLTAIILTNTKGYVLVQVAYMVKTLYSEENFKKDAEEATKMFERDINDVIVATKKYMVKASTEMWRCDPDHHVRGETYVEITNFLHGYIENTEAPRCDDTNTSKSLPFKLKQEKCCKIWSHQPICSRVKKCKSIDSAMDICLSDIVQYHKRYEYVEFKDGRVFGKKKNCERHKISLQDWQVGNYLRCSYRFCLCVEGPRYFSDRYINLRELKANVTANRVVTGLRFVKHNRIIHLQVQEGRLLPEGQIDNATVRWVPVEDYQTIGSGISANADYFRLSWEERSLELNDLMADEGFVVTGVSFRHDGRLKLEIQTTPFNFTTGQLINPGISSVVKIRKRTYLEMKFRHFGKEVKLDQPDVPTRRTKPSTDRFTDGFVRFTHSDYDKDAAQTTVPFFDAQPVRPAVPVPLSGVGIYHKGARGCGGFVAPRVFAYDSTKYLKSPFFPKK
jgi:hypothetical protein